MNRESTPFPPQLSVQTSEIPTAVPMGVWLMSGLAANQEEFYLQTFQAFCAELVHIEALGHQKTKIQNYLKNIF